MSDRDTFDDLNYSRRRGLAPDRVILDEVLRGGGAPGRGALFADPVLTEEEVLRWQRAAGPPIYTVISFRVRHPGGGRVYDYAAIRAGDGKWYPTGGETRQGVDWPTLVRAIRARLVGPISILGPIRQVFV